MNSLMTLLFVLVPMLLGFFIQLPKLYLSLVDKILVWLVYIMLFLIGISLSQVENLAIQLEMIIRSVVWLFICVMGMNLLVLMYFDRCFPWQVQGENKKTSVSMLGGVKQLGCVFLGFIFGFLMKNMWLPSEKLNLYCLMFLVFLVGVQLKGSGITLRHVLLNKRGVQTSILMVLSSLSGGLLFASMMPDVSWTKGLALASGFGWYSLSGVVMTEAYGPIWGSVMLLNDLGRELFALVFIPLLMKKHPSAAVGVGGATSLDFTLPIIQNSGGLQVLPLAISFGFIVNMVAPFLMVVFLSFGS